MPKIPTHPRFSPHSLAAEPLAAAVVGGMASSAMTLPQRIDVLGALLVSFGRLTGAHAWAHTTAASRCVEGLMTQLL